MSIENGKKAESIVTRPRAAKLNCRLSVTMKKRKYRTGADDSL